MMIRKYADDKFLLNKDLDSSLVSRNSKRDDTYFRNKIVVISFLMAVCIVYQHTKYHSVENETVNDLRDFAFFLWTTCVPVFFAISGYLFFRNFQINMVGAKLRRRIKSLLIPYLIWNSLYVIFMLFFYRLGFVKEIAIAEDFSGILQGILNAECSPLWFVRYLMLFACFAPLTYFILKYRVWGALLIMGMIGYNYYNYFFGEFNSGIDVNANTLVMFNYQFVFFATGAYAALCWSKVVETPNKTKSIVGIIGLILLSLYYWIYIRHNGTIVSNHLFRWLWVVMFWFAYDALPDIKMKAWMRFAFFIYCTHMFLVYCIQGVTTRIYSILGPVSQYFTTAEYLLLAIIVVFVLIKVASILKNKQPWLFNISTGGRG